jgi:hypothetical protein
LPSLRSFVIQLFLDWIRLNDATLQETSSHPKLEYSRCRLVLLSNVQRGNHNIKWIQKTAFQWNFRLIHIYVILTHL